ncbi:MAG TPA: ABC transporter substrate-binding protein [Syntrophobacteraceae bacterium]|nr:ABC transporter substrate-binding protein [Syntrophobacteraceae bacterium]HBZ56243.1 ABC transporter substrate-binding protein [Syntrophobacteraceae bacterium]
MRHKSESKPGKRYGFRLVVLVTLIACGLWAGAVWAAEPIKIGAFFALSGPAATIGTPTKLVAQMVVERINQAGGINNRPIELVVGDTESDPTKALMVAKRLVENDKVVALIGPTRTDEGMAVKAYVEKAQIPTIMTVGGDPVISVPPFQWTFKTPQRTSVAVKKTYEYLKKQGLAKIALVTATDGFGKDGLNWLEKLAPDFGLQIVSSEAFGVSDTDMTPQLVKIKDSGAQAIICWTIGPAGARVAKNVKQLGITVPLVQCHGQPDPKYVELAGDAAEGSVMPSTKLMVAGQLPATDPQKAVILDFIELYKGARFDQQYPINTHSGYAWDAIFLLANAMREVGSEPQALRGAIEQIRGYVGISGIFSLSAEDHNGLGTDSLVMVKIEKGQWVLLKP